MCVCGGGDIEYAYCLKGAGSFACLCPSMLYLHLALRLCNKVSEDGVASISHKGAGLEDVHTTDSGRLTKLLVGGAETLHDCTQEAALEGGGGGRREERRRGGREEEEGGGKRRRGGREEEEGGGKRKEEGRGGRRREEKLEFDPIAVITELTSRSLLALNEAKNVPPSSPPLYPLSPSLSLPPSLPPSLSLSSPVAAWYLALMFG